MNLSSDLDPASFDADDIVALASAAGFGAIAVVRCSGPRLLVKIQGILEPKHGGVLSPRTMTYCLLRDPESGQVIDDVMAVVYQGPSSYTGEDSVEIFPHGGRYIVESVVRLLLKLGLRYADAGEFTRRAFLNGKLDLVQAEGIRGLTEAQSEHEWRVARAMLGGALSRQVAELRGYLLEALAYLEARIDFPDEKETSAVETALIEDRVSKVAVSLKRLVDSYQSGKVAASGLRVALLGEPNVGKSTLMNTLIGEDRAIVTDIAGTTRDYLEEACLLKGRLIRLFDTAGIRQTSEKIEEIGISRSLMRAQEAEVILHLVAPDSQSSPQIDEFLKTLNGKAILTIMTKADLGKSCQSNLFTDLKISCVTRQGIDQLIEALVALVDSNVNALGDKDGAYLATPRHLAACDRAMGSLELFQSALAQGLYDECLAFELKGAADALRSVIGGIDHDDVLDVIFSQFCVGK